MEWTMPDFEEIETSCEVTAYVAHWWVSWEMINAVMWRM